MSSSNWQRTSQVLALLLVVLVGAAAFVVIFRSGQPAATPTPTPSAIALSSPTTTVTETSSPSPIPTPTPTARPTHTPRPTRTPRPTPTPITETPSPMPTPTPPPLSTPRPSAAAVPVRAIRFVGLGFDGAAAATPTQRTISFLTDGPGTVTARLYKTSAGSVHFCLSREGGSGTCQDADHAALSGTTNSSGQTSWVVTGIGTGAPSPIADVRITFQAEHPSVTIGGFRFQGTENEGYNGVEADFDTGGGKSTVRVRGSLSGGPAPWEIRLINSGSPLLPVISDQTGAGTSLSFAAETGAQSVHLSINNRQLISNHEIFLSAVIRWQ
jgi:hypothetical protein